MGITLYVVEPDHDPGRRGQQGQGPFGIHVAAQGSGMASLVPVALLQALVVRAPGMGGKPVPGGTQMATAASVQA